MRAIRRASPGFGPTVAGMRTFPAGSQSADLHREREQERAFEEAIVLLRRAQRRQARAARMAWLRDRMAGRRPTG